MTLHVAGELHALHSSDSVFPDAFRPWKAQLIRDGVPPVIAVAGSRGKSTVANLLELMFAEAGLVCAKRSSRSVTIGGVRQSDAAAWQRVQDGQTNSDIAIDELTWEDTASLEAGRTLFAVTAVTNICANREDCLLQGFARLALASLPRLVDATAVTGALVLNSEDHSIIGRDLDHGRSTVFVGQDRENPVLQFHLECDGIGAWRTGDLDAELRCGMLGRSSSFGKVEDLRFALRGAAAFQITNALTAVSVAASCGVPHDAIRRALRLFAASHDGQSPVFHSCESHNVRIVIDRPNPSWCLRQVVRAVRDANARRVITIAGRLDSVPQDDLPEIGRLLGRLSGVIVVHSAVVDDIRVRLLRQGVAQNPTPPVIVHRQNEERAMTLALERARPDDLVFVLADDASIVHRVIGANAGRTEWNSTDPFERLQEASL